MKAAVGSANSAFVYAEDGLQGDADFVHEVAKLSPCVLPFVSAEMRDEEQKGTPVTQANGDGGDTSDSTGVIVGVVVAMIILLCVGVAGFVMYKRSSDEAVRSSLKHHSRTRGNDNRAGQFFLSPFF